TKVGSLSLRSLLAHTSGLPAMNPLADYSGTKERLYAAIAREPLEAEPGRRLIYSDVGYMLAQGVIERIAKKSLDRLARERIFAPLGFRDTAFRSRAGDRRRVAPTERLRGDAGPWLRGRVHDPRARSHALEGVAGNAGMFGTAEETARFCVMMLRGGRSGRAPGLAAGTVRLLTTKQWPPPLLVPRGVGVARQGPGP